MTIDPRLDPLLSEHGPRDATKTAAVVLGGIRWCSPTVEGSPGVGRGLEESRGASGLRGRACLFPG